MSDRQIGMLGTTGPTLRHGAMVKISSRSGSRISAGTRRSTTNALAGPPETLMTSSGRLIPARPVAHGRTDKNRTEPAIGPTMLLTGGGC